MRYIRKFWNRQKTLESILREANEGGKYDYKL